MLALHRFIKDENGEIVALINMCDESGNRSKSHGIESGLIKQQADCLGFNVIQIPTNNNNYRDNLVKAIYELKRKGVEAGVFGDIFLQEHRDWIEDVCKETGIKAIFPLWACDTKGLLNEFINEGFRSMVVAVVNDKLDQSWLGRVMDREFQEDILKMDGIDPCAEYGEYHTFVFDGPIFNKSIELKTGEIFSDGKSSFMQVV